MGLSGKVAYRRTRQLGSIVGLDPTSEDSRRPTRSPSVSSNTAALHQCAINK